MAATSEEKLICDKFNLEALTVKAKKKICVFTVTRPTLFFSRRPLSFLSAIIRH